MRYTIAKAIITASKPKLRTYRTLWPVTPVRARSVFSRLGSVPISLFIFRCYLVRHELFTQATRRPTHGRFVSPGEVQW